jgi:hypothetical protein
MSGYRFLIWCYVVCAILMMVLFFSAFSAHRGIDRRHDTKQEVRRATITRDCDQTRGTVLAGCFRRWFDRAEHHCLLVLSSLRHRSESARRHIFGINLLASLSFLRAPALARRFRLLKTMVFSDLPSNVLLLVPSMRTLECAITMLLARNLLSQLDVPTRQSYTMAVCIRRSVRLLLAFSRFRATRVRQ